MITVSILGNFLTIDNGSKIEYLNAGWCTIRFTNDAVFIKDIAKSGNGYEYEILFTEFQDATPTAYASESAIATYLSDKIG